MIRLLGLNLCPVEDENGRLRSPVESEIIPHSLWACGGEALFGEVMKKQQEWADQANIDEDIQSSLEDPNKDMTLEELEELMGDLGDIDFTSGPTNLDWDSDEAKKLRQQLITTVDEPLTHVPQINKKSRVVIEELDDGDVDFTAPKSIVIQSTDGDQ